MRNHSHQGLTVIEVLISFALVATAALGVIAAMTRIMLAQSSTAHQTVAQLIAESKVQEAIVTADDDVKKDEKGTVTMAIGQASEPTEFFYELKAIPVVTTVTAGRDMGKLTEYKCKVFWNADNADDGPRSAVGRGTSTVEVARIAFFQR